MEDGRIIELYFERSEDAIRETDKKYGGYCRKIAYNILYSAEDSEECVSDTYFKAWESIPPQRPNILSAFLGRITRNLALNRYAFLKAEKRKPKGEISLEELEGVLESKAPDPLEEMILRDAINGFVASLSKESRMIFVRRYWYLDSIKEIARDYKIPEGTVKSILSRTKSKFVRYLKKEGIEL